MVQTVQRDRPIEMEGAGLASPAKEKIERFPVLEGIRKYVKEHRQVLLVGRPGSGKSTTLARLLLEEAQNSFALGPPSPPSLGGTRSQNIPQPKMGRTQSPPELGDLGGRRELASHPESIAQYIPVLVELRFWSGSLLDRIQAFFQRHRLQLDRTQIEDLLFHRRLLLLMDGLNELSSEAVRLDVAKFRQDYPQVLMIFTTRDLSLGGDFGLERKLEMQPLTEDQMKTFVRSYVPEQAEAMLRQLKERLREFGQTPLLLWMLCGLFRQTGEIPNNLGEVFRAFTQGYEKNLKADVPVESDRRWWPELLQELAFWMMRGKPFGEPVPEVDVEFRAAIPKTEARQIFAAFLQGKEAQAEGTAQKYLDDLLRHHLIQPNGEQVEFRHQLLQEYYAAEYLLTHSEQMSELEFNRDYLNYLKWTESISLMIGLSKEKSALQVVKSATNVDLILSARLAKRVKSESKSIAVKTLITLELPEWLKFKLIQEIRSEVENSQSLQLSEVEDFDEYFDQHGGRFLQIFNLLGLDKEALAYNVSDYIRLIESSIEKTNRMTGLYCLGASFLVGQKASEQVILILLKILEDQNLDLRCAAGVSLILAFRCIHGAHYLPQLAALIPTLSGQVALRVMSFIQSKCKFYNYDIIQTTQSMKLFFSYAHKDEPLRDELAKHLSLLKRQNIITDWHDRNITAGTEWAQAIDDNLNTANIILLLISSDFLASEYCWTKEMDPALERHNQGTARVIPIILRPCDWHSASFGKLQALPIVHSGGAKPVTQWDNQDEAFTNIAQGIRKAVEELQQNKSIT